MTPWFCHVFGFLSTRKTCFYQKRRSVTMLNYMETFHANIGPNLTWKVLTRYLSSRKLKLWPPSSKRYNSKMQRPQPHVLLFFLISCNFSIRCTVANFVIWMSQKSCNIIIWHNFNTEREICTRHSCQNSF